MGSRSDGDRKVAASRRPWHGRSASETPILLESPECGSVQRLAIPGESFERRVGPLDEELQRRRQEKVAESRNQVD